MGVVAVIRTVPYDRVSQELLPELERSLRARDVEPLRRWIDFQEVAEAHGSEPRVTTLKPGLLRFVLPERSFTGLRDESGKLRVVFRPPGAALLAMALDRLATSEPIEVPLGLGSPVGAVAAALQSLSAGDAELWASLFDHDRLLPDYLRGDEGPSLATPEELRRVRDSLAALPAAIDDPGRFVEALRRVIASAPEDAGLFVQLH